MNHQGQIIDGGDVRLLNAAAFMIHGAVHQARPDVMCAAHSHSIYGRTFCALGRKLDIITQDACSFYDVGEMAILGDRQLKAVLGPCLV